MPATIYRKTVTGQAALATRGGGLSARERTALIVVNGRQTRAQLLAALGADASTLLDVLLAQGLIEVVAAAPVRPSARVAAAGPVQAPVPPPATDPVADTERLRSLQQTALTLLAPHFGPDVKVVCLPLLQARTRAEWQAALAAIEAKLGIYLGRKAAQGLVASLRL